MRNNTVKLFLISGLFLISVLPLAAQNNERILIAYFTWAENTEVLDRARAVNEANSHVFSVESGSGVDTVTTASVIPPGNTRRLAEWIQAETGGDLFSIRVVDKYSCYWDEILNRAAEEKARDARPELSGTIGNLQDYDVIFLGFPTWWYTIPMPVASFVESYNYSGKTIIPFVSHGTSGKARTIMDLKRLLPSSVSLEREIGIYRSETAGARREIDQWLDELGY